MYYGFPFLDDKKLIFCNGRDCFYWGLVLVLGGVLARDLIPTGLKVPWASVGLRLIMMEPYRLWVLMVIKRLDKSELRLTLR